MHEGDFMEELLKRMGERIRQARLAHNLTQAELAEKIDVSLAFMSIICAHSFDNTAYSFSLTVHFSF